MSCPIWSDWRAARSLLVMLAETATRIEMRGGSRKGTPPSPDTRIATAPASIGLLKSATPATAREGTVRVAMTPAIRAAASYRVAALAGPGAASRGLTCAFPIRARDSAVCAESLVRPRRSAWHRWPPGAIARHPDPSQSSQGQIMRPFCQVWWVTGVATHVASWYATCTRSSRHRGIAEQGGARNGRA
jgi:hypothetical protein